MRAASLLLPILLLRAADPTPPAQAPTPAEIAERRAQRPVQVFTGPGRWRWMPAPNPPADPIAPLAEAELTAWEADGRAPDAKAFLAAAVDRLEAAWKDRAPAGLVEWLAARPDLRRSFWLALSPRFDDIPAALRVLDDLRTTRAKAVERLPHLAIAVAVVWDQPDAVQSSRWTFIWGMQPAQFAPAPAFGEVFDWFADEKRQAALVFKPHQMTWAMMVHLVDLELGAAERAWAHATQAARRTDIASLYPLVPYDYAKLDGAPKLGSSPYTLENVLRCGGVCGDQAWFSSRVAKAFGVPAMTCGGESRWGGAGHAWSGYLAAVGGRPVLQFTGRYQFDYYYTGDIFDPQTRTMTLDRYVALQYDGVSLSFAKAETAAALARAALVHEQDRAQASVALAREALKANVFCADAWRVLMRHAASGALPRKEAQTLVGRMFKDLAAHPDLTIECLDLYLAGVPMDQIDERQRLFAAAHQLYAARPEQDRRPDLQVALRMRQCAELVAARREREALTLALDTTVRNAKEGTLILPLVEYVVTTSKAFAATAKDFRLDVVKQALAKAETDFPKQRGSTVSKAWVEWQRLVAGF